MTLLKYKGSGAAAFEIAQVGCAGARVTVTVRREAGEEQVAPVHYDEGIANHIGPEPCVVGREAGGEASAGAPIGQPSSRERINRDADVCHERKAKRGRASTRAHVRSRVVEDPGMYVNSSTGNRETSTLAAREASGPHREGDEPKLTCALRRRRKPNQITQVGGPSSERSAGSAAAPALYFT